jgi:hypothetical protein
MEHIIKNREEYGTFDKKSRAVTTEISLKMIYMKLLWNIL